MQNFTGSYDIVYYGTVITLAFLMVLMVIPSIIYVANQRLLFDDQETSRKTHSRGISRLGGVAIFCSFTVTSLIFSELNGFYEYNYLLASCIILLAVGLKDDLSGVNPSTKFLMQFIVATIMVVLGDIRITSMYSVFNVYELSYAASVTLSVLVILLLINALNLIDGIDGLAGTIGLIVSLTLGLMFANMGHTGFACIAFALVGALLGFLRYNLTPARIFMGDTGSLLLGLVLVVLSIKFIELNKHTASNTVPLYSSAPSIAVAVLIVPMFDAVRVFVLRLAKKSSPFVADTNHIHHRLLKTGMTHLQATFVLMVFNIAVILLILSIRNLGNYVLMILLLGICILSNMFLTFMLRSKERKSYKFINILW